MCALVYLREIEEKEETSSLKEPFSVCTKCGRFIRIDGHCECEAIFFDMLIKTD
jgi:hypothetical protein